MVLALSQHFIPLGIAITRILLCVGGVGAEDETKLVMATAELQIVSTIALSEIIRIKCGVRSDRLSELRLSGAVCRIVVFPILL